MGFAAIAVGIGIEACARQAMHITGYAYPPEIRSSKSQKMTSISGNLQSKLNGITVSKAGLNSRLVKHSALEFRSKVSRKDKDNLVC
jgi:hypothetical protein